MADYFFDSSAMLKRYVNETGTTWVDSLVDVAAGNRIRVVSLTGVEVVAAITRRQRGGTIPLADAALALSRFRQELALEFVLMEMAPSLISQAMVLAETHGLRGSDAIQLAAALEARVECQVMGLPLTLVSADAELNAAAVAEGLTVDDPTTHP